MKLIVLLFLFLFIGFTNAQNKITVSRPPFDGGGPSRKTTFSSKYISFNPGIQNLRIFSSLPNTAGKNSLFIYSLEYSFPMAWKRKRYTKANVFFLYQPKANSLNQFNAEYFISGYQVGLELFGHMFFYDTNGFHLIVNSGVGFGVKTLVREINGFNLSKYSNPFSLVTASMEPQYIIRNFKIGLKTKAQYDFSKSNWKFKNGAIENLGGFRATGMTFMLSVGIRV